MATSTLPLLAAVDEIIAKVRGKHEGIPDITVVLGQSGRTRRGQTHGHFAPEAWHSFAKDGAVTHEMMLSGESLARGAEATLGTIIHELAHAFAHANGITDTSNNHRYHNKKFKEIGERFGIELEQADTIGWSVTTVPDRTLEEYADELEALKEALTQYRVPPAEQEKKTAKKYQMQCPTCEDPVTVTKKWFANNEYRIYCHEHGLYFEFVED